MKARSTCLVLAVGLLLLAVLVGLTVFGLRILQQRQELARWEYQPPVARISEPVSGTEAPVGSYLTAVAFVTFPARSPAQRVEWYLDGILVESHPLQLADGVSRTYDSLDLLLAAEGTHVLMARAVDGRGLAGLSQPLVLRGVAKGESFYAVSVNEGETLEDIAGEYASDAATLAALNPGLDPAPAPGTIVKVPIPPEDESPSPPPAPPAPAGPVPLAADSPMLKVSAIPSRILSLLAATPPQAPANLQGEVKGCQVRLIWEDHAEDETGYEVWMAAAGGPLTRLAALQPAASSAAWFEFPAPGPGSFLFWVEAVNAVGQRGSNIIPLDVDAGCPIGAPTHLQVEILDFATTANVERAYCYVSFENAPETRIPANETGFITIQAGHGDLASWPHSFTLPIPQDGTLDLSGECWGWSGPSLSPLGPYSLALVRETWDGAPRQAQSGAYALSLAVRYETPTGTKMTFAERSPDLPSGSFPGFLEETLPIDPTLPVPVITAMVESTNYPLLTANCNPHCQSLIWKWQGDEAKIRGFVVYLNGLPYAAVFPFPSMRSVLVQPPISACGGESRWQVAAVTHSAMSSLSAEYVLAGPNPLSQDQNTPAKTCTFYVKVKFEVLDLEWTHEGYGSGGPGDCDTLDALYYIHADERGTATEGAYLYATRKFYSGEFPRAMSCGVHGYQDLFDRVNPALVSPGAPVPVATYEHGQWPFSEIILAGDLLRPDQSIILLIGAHFYDHDDTSADDWIAKYGTEYAADNFQDAIDYFGCGKTFIDDDEMDSGKSRLQYTITIYPNACERIPEGLE